MSTTARHCEIKRGRGRYRDAALTVEHGRALKLGQEDNLYGFEELIIFKTDDDLLNLALDIIGRQPALTLAENERMQKLVKIIQAGT